MDNKADRIRHLVKGVKDLAEITGETVGDIMATIQDALSRKGKGRFYDGGEYLDDIDLQLGGGGAEGRNKEKGFAEKEGKRPKGQGEGPQR